MEMTKTNHFAFGAALIIALLFTLLLAAKPAYAATFTVNLEGDALDANTADSKCDMIASIPGDQCTLRAAIQQANATDDADIINFNIPDDPNIPGNEVKTIRPNSELPTITGTLTIDGYTQSGATENTETQPGKTNASPKIELDGTNAGGAFGLIIRTTAPNSVVRGMVINRFAIDAIFLEPGSKGNRIEGNFIGTDSGGTLNRGNGGRGVGIGGFIPGNAGNTVGGTSLGTRNLISGNGGVGVGVSSPGNKVQGNIIGANKDGTGALGNNFGGVSIVDASNNTIGGSSTAANTIAFNGGDGVGVFYNSFFSNAPTGNRIHFNSIFSNGLLGIDLGGDGRTANDPRDRDTGPNALQNFPVLTSAYSSFTGTTIKGTLNSTPSGKRKKNRFVIQFFSNPAGGDEGKTFLGQKTVTTSRKGNASFTFTPIQAVSIGEVVTATATNSKGNTSEFSDPLEVVSPPP